MCYMYIVHVHVGSDSQIHDRDLDTDFCLLVVRKLLRTNSKHVKVGSQHCCRHRVGHRDGRKKTSLECAIVC